MDDHAPSCSPTAQPTAVINSGQARPATPLSSTGPQGEVLGHFELMETLGSGGCGVVVKAFDRKLRREVAIKRMTADLASTAASRERFVREARAAAAVRHENVVQIYAVEEHDQPYLVMELVPGRSLQRHLEDRGPLEVAEVLQIGVQIARGLGAAHDVGLVHRDVKPGNILIDWVDGTPRVKLTDFGIAQATDEARLTHSGMVVGTPLYMSPEQAQGETVDHRSDLHSLGSVLFEMTTGRLPCRAKDGPAVVEQSATENPNPVREVAPEAPDWLCKIICRLQAKRPEDRFQSAREVADLLEKCLAELNRPEGVRLPVWPTRRQPTGWIAAAVALVVGVGLVVGSRFSTLAPKGTSTPTVAFTEAAVVPLAKEDADKVVAQTVPPPSEVVERELDPTRQPTVEELTAELRRRNPAFKGSAVMRFEEGKCVELQITLAEGLVDITPVRRLRDLQAFKAERSKITDLSPLQGLPLKTLWLNCNAVLRDLSPLRGMKLERLALWWFQGTDLSPLEGMPLKYLNCGGGWVKLDLKPLRGLPLTYLNLNSTHVSDLSPLEGMPLVELSISPSRVKDLTPLANMKTLRRLYAKQAPITDFSPLVGLPLEVVVIDLNPTRDVAVLQSIPTLKEINKKPAYEFWAIVTKK